jgi:hypothetical protein
MVGVVVVWFSTEGKKKKNKVLNSSVAGSQIQFFGIISLML